MKKINFKYPLLGTLLIPLIAVYLVISEITFINKCELVKAKITDIKFTEAPDDDSNDEYTLSLQILSSGKIINGLQFDTGFTDPEFKTGQIVELYYDTKEPNNSEIKNIWKQWGICLILGLVFIADLTIMGILFVVMSNKTKTVTDKDAIVSE